MPKTKGEKVPVIFSRSIYSHKTTKIIVSFLVIGALIIYPLIHSKQIKAEEAIFYPENCSGSWSNAAAAAGSPSENSEGLSADVAQATGGGQEIICTDFKGELPAGANIVKAELELIWSIGQRTIIPQSAPIEESFDPVSIEAELIDEAASEDNTSSENAPPETEINEPIIEESAPEESTIEGSTSEESAPVPEPAPANEALPEVLPPTSWLNKIFGLEAKAQEESIIEAPVESPEVLPLAEEVSETILSEEEAPEEQASDNQAEAPTEVLESIPEPETETVMSNPIQGTALFDLSYDLNENSWQAIGQVEREQMAERYPVPLTYEDISALKISLISLITLDGINDIFLEAVKLVITYDEIIESTVVDQPDLTSDILLDEALSEGVWAIRVKRAETNLYEIWYADPQYKEALPNEVEVSNIWTLVATDDYIHEFSPLGADEGFIFWLNKSGQAIYMYNSAGQTLNSREYKPEEGADYIIYKNSVDEYKKIVLDFSERKFELAEVSEDEIAEYETVAEEVIDYSLLPKVSVKPAERNILVDPEATHFCIIPSGQINIVNQKLTPESVILQGNPNLAFELEIVAVPPGIKIEFTKTKTVLYSSTGKEDKVEIEIKNEKDSQAGNFSVPIIYTQKSDSDNSTVICQLNIINQ